MSIMDLLESDAILTGIALLFATFWTLCKGSDWLVEHRHKRLREALRALEAGVEATYREYVRALKEQRPDGRLTLEEQQTARAYAKDRAEAIARVQGIDLMGVIGAEFIDLWICKLVRKLKTG